MARTSGSSIVGRWAIALVRASGSQSSVRSVTRQNLEACFTPERSLRSITPADADHWRAWLAKEQKLAPATISRRVIAARTMWRAAVRWRLAAENPFQGVKGGRQSNESRKRYIPPSVIARALEAAPNASWRAIIVLARFGGLRTPSETFLLKWSDIDWERKTVRVTSPKLAHFERLGERIIPLFPELVEPLLALFDEAEEGEEYVIPAAYRLGAGNLRTTFTKIIRRAGEIPWPKLWHNLRDSRESELMREYDLPTVCRWIGNSPKVAAEHYATSIDLDGDFKRATDPATNSLTEAQQKAQQKAQQSTLNGDTQSLTDESKNAVFPEENGDFVIAGQALNNTDETTQYARQDSNL